jgi:ketosteroid isomerase-like protein
MARPTDVFLPDSRDLQGRLRARRVAEAHFDAELSNDADAILVSMKSYDPLFTTILRDVMRGSKEVFRCNTVEEQREFYRSGREHMDMTQVDILTSIGGDWYGFVHGITHTALKASGDMLLTEIVGLLPITEDEDTIAGEIGMSMPPYGFQGEEPGALPLQRVAMLEVYHRWIHALGSRDAQTVADCYADDAEIAVFDPAQGAVVVRTGRESIGEFYESFFDAFRSVTIERVLQVVDRWFVFTELLWQVTNAEGEVRWFRTGDVLVPSPERRIVTQLGVGTKVVDHVEQRVPAPA